MLLFLMHKLRNKWLITQILYLTTQINACMTSPADCRPWQRYFEHCTIQSYFLCVQYICVPVLYVWLYYTVIIDVLEMYIVCEFWSQSFKLLRYLPSNFPKEIPIVSVVPAVKHPWVNDQVMCCFVLHDNYTVHCVINIV